jgi:diguanylate cyclase (GGDEF)-like protein/PAS domain S-box-containing protein
MPKEKSHQPPDNCMNNRPARDEEEHSSLRAEIANMRDQLARKNHFTELILLTSPNFIYIYDLQEKRIVFASQTHTLLLGLSTEKILTMDGSELESRMHPEDIAQARSHYDLFDLVKDGDVVEMELRVKHAHGDWNWVAIRETPHTRGAEGQVIQVLGTAENVTERRMAQEKYWYISSHDKLTGLYNRLFYEEELSRLERGRHFPVTVMIADVDGLKEVNERLGNAAGDLIIQNAAEIIKGCFRAEDMVARIGGDEFAVLLPDIATISVDAIQVRVRRQLDGYNNSHPKSPVRISFGFATADRGEMLREIAREADRRMEINKAAARSKPRGSPGER